MTHHDLYIDVLGPTDGPPVLLLHGWGSRAEHMMPVARGLSDRYRTHVVDLPGHGHSPPPPSPWGVPEHADLVRAYIDAEIGTSVSLVGHSNGGRIGLFMAATSEYADRIDRLVLISPSGIRPHRSLSTRLKSGLAKTLKTPLQGLPAPLREPALDWLRHSFVWSLLASSDYNASSGVMRQTFVKTVTHHLDDVVGQVPVPVLLFWGTHDTAISRRQMDTLCEAIDDCGLVELPGADHYGHLRQVDTVVSATRYFLAHDAPTDASETPAPAHDGSS